MILFLSLFSPGLDLCQDSVGEFVEVLSWSGPDSCQNLPVVVSGAWVLWCLGPSRGVQIGLMIDSVSWFGLGPSCVQCVLVVGVFGA